MLDFLLTIWATPTMTVGHLLVAAATAAYTLVTGRFEERDLVSSFGGRYEAYRRRLRMLIPLPKARGL